jgi:hypothetical protein
LLSHPIPHSPNVFFNPRPICGYKCYDGLTLTTWSMSYRIGEVI